MHPVRCSASGRVHTDSTWRAATRLFPVDTFCSLLFDTFLSYIGLSIRNEMTGQ